MKVLYVDDEEDIREVAALALELDPDLDVKTEPSGAAALKTAAEWRPDVILLDVMMPHMDGPTTLAQLRSRDATKQIPVIFITARAQPREIQDLKARGAVHVMTKPFDPMDLAPAVRRLMTR
jgi:CheY-like chemotaxis protein